MGQFAPAPCIRLFLDMSEKAVWFKGQEAKLRARCRTDKPLADLLQEVTIFLDWARGTHIVQSADGPEAQPLWGDCLAGKFPKAGIEEAAHAAFRWAVHHARGVEYLLKQRVC